MAAIKLAGLNATGALGIAGLLRDSYPTLLPWPSLNLHAIFGTLLCSLVIIRFRQASSAHLMVADMHQLSRRMSREVYVLLYVLVGTQLLMQMTAASPNSIARPPENLRDYFAYGALAILAIRALAALKARQLLELRMSPQLAPAEGAAALR